MNKVYAVLINTVSIQKYIFGSNKLKENLGASFLVQDIYQDMLKDVIEDVFSGQQFDFHSWKKEPEKILISNQPFEVGYIGGGNALLLFKEEEDAKTFIKKWTKDLLLKAPGVTTAVACEEIDLNNFQEDQEKLFSELIQNKARYIPQTIIPRHGITAECARSGLSMDIWSDSEGAYISSVTNGKIEASEKKAKKKLEKEYKDILKDEFLFTDDLGELGQSEDENSHIAIVHIDGNEMGKRFQAVKKLEDIRKLSVSVEKATKTAFESLLVYICNNFNKISKEINLTYEDRKAIMPLRPIILGGDDITFVADGRLGIYFAKIFIEEFEKQKVSDGRPLSACAGIAVTKTKYPFYRGYELAEELCKSAKKRRNDKKDKEDYTSWLDFHISQSSFSGSLEDIRNDHFMAVRGNLLMRPYILSSDGEYSFKNLVKNTGYMKKKFPNLKIKELRSVLTKGEEEGRMFVEEQEYRDRKLPEFLPRKYHKQLFDDFTTPYFDMIELMEFYPDFELERK